MFSYLYTKLKQYIRMQYEVMVGEPFTEKQILINKYLLAKRLLKEPVNKDDHNIEPFGKDRELVLNTLNKVKSLQQFPYNCNHLETKIEFNPVRSTYSVDLISVCKDTYRVFRDLLHTTSAAVSLEPGKMENLVEGQLVLAIKPYVNSILNHTWYKFKKKEYLQPSYSIQDFIHDDLKKESYDPSYIGIYANYYNGDGPTSGGGNNTNIYEEYFTSKWKTNMDPFFKFKNYNSELFPLNRLDDYYSLYSYFLYKNVGINYLNYTIQKSHESTLEKMLSYTSNGLFLEYLSSRLSLDWNSIIIKLFNRNYSDTFVNPLFNFINNRAYYRIKHNKADSLALSANLFRAKRRSAHWDGFIPHKSRLREIYEDHLVDAARKAYRISHGGKAKYKRLRMSTARAMMTGERSKINRHVYEGRDHLPVDYSSKYPVFYDLLDFYRTKANVNPLSRLKFNGPLTPTNIIPNYDTRWGSRLYRRLGYVNLKIESDNASPYILYINKLQQYLIQNQAITHSSYKSLDSLFDVYLSHLNKNEINSLLQTYFFRSNYLKDLYHRFNFTSIAARSKSTIIRRHLISKNKYSMKPYHKFDNSVHHNLYVKLNRYDINTRLKLELINSFNIDVTKTSFFYSKLNPFNLDLIKFNILDVSDIFLFLLSTCTIFGVTIFNFYANIELFFFSIFNENVLYPWMNPVIQNIQSFWYSSQYFYLNFDNFEQLVKNNIVQYQSDFSLNDIYNSPFDQLKENYNVYIKLKNIDFIDSSSIYEPNSFFSNQYYYYIYQAKNVIKLPYYPIFNSSIIYFQWDNMPLIDLVSHSYSINLLRYYEQLTYQFIKYDINHLVLLSAKDLYFNIINQDIYSIGTYYYLSILEIVASIITIMFTFMYHFMSPWVVGFVAKFSLFHSLSLFNDGLNNLIFLNIKHLFLDLPYWYIVDSITAILFHWYRFTYSFSAFFSGSFWFPIWFLYNFIDNYLKTYLFDYYYYYYNNLLQLNNITLGNYLFSLYSLSIYWIVWVPLFYLFRFIFITFFIESYGIFLFVFVFFYYYLNYLNSLKKYSWLFKGVNTYDIRKWMLKYQVYYNEYHESFIRNTELLKPYYNRIFSNSTSLRSRFVRGEQSFQNNINIWRHHSISGYKKYPNYKNNFFNYPDVTQYLFNLNHISVKSSLDNTSNSFYKDIIFTDQYLKFRNKVRDGFSKFPLFGSYPTHVQPYYRKSLQLFSTIVPYNNLFSDRFSCLIPFILLGKYYEDRNFIASLKASSSNILSEINRKSYHMNDNFYFRYYYLRKYFPFYARAFHSFYRIKNLTKRHRKRGNRPSYFDLNYKYIVWDGGSHSVFLIPGISSLVDESIIDIINSDVPLYRQNLLQFLHKDNSTFYEDWYTDGSFPDVGSDLNLGLQSPEVILTGARDLVSTIERQRRIIYSFISYRPGFKRLYPHWVYRLYEFKKTTRNELYEEAKLTDWQMNRIDQVHEYYFIKGRVQVDVKQNQAPYLKKTISLYNWKDYKTHLLWYIHKLKNTATYTSKYNDGWKRDYDLGSLFQNYNYEFSILRNNFLYPIYFYNSLNEDYKYSFAWYKLHKLHNLNLYYKKNILPNWELSKTWEFDMGIINNSDIDDSLESNYIKHNFLELFDATINSKFIPTPGDLYRFNDLGQKSSPSKVRKLILMKLHYKELLTRKALMGKYYRYLHYKHSIDMSNIDFTTGKAFQFDFRNHPNRFIHNFHYLGLTGRVDFILDRLSYDFDTGWVRFFNFIGYKKYNAQRPSIDPRARRLNKMLVELTRTEAGLQQFHSLDAFANSNIYTTFITEFGELSSGIYYAWLTQQMYTSNSLHKGFNLNEKYKYSHFIGNIRLLRKYGYTKYSKIKDTLRDTHNYINYISGHDHYPISLKSLENFYEYDRFTMVNEPLDVRWDGRLAEGLAHMKTGKKHILFKHFRDTGPRVFKFRKTLLYKKYKRSFHREAPFIDVVAKRPGDLSYTESSCIDLLSNRVVSESMDHLHNLFNLNFDLAKLELKPILFYKIPPHYSGQWINLQESLFYYNWYDNEVLNKLKEFSVNSYGGSWKYYYFNRLLNTTEYDYIFENTLNNRYDKSLDYELLKSYCDRDLTGALLTKRYLIYKEKIRSISPNASIFFSDYYPEYIWEYYDFNWYEEVKNDWFIIIPLFALFFVYYMNIPHDYYKFSRKRFKRTLYVHHINRRKRGGPKNGHRRLFAIPNKLKKRRLSFYRIQSKNNIIWASVLNKRKNIKNREYLYPYRTINPYKYEYVSKSQLKFASRLGGRKIRLNNPRKFVFYSGYTIQLRMNRRRSRRAIRHRLKGFHKDKMYSSMKILKNFQYEPYNTRLLKDQEIDSYLKVWSRSRTPRSSRRFKRRPNPYRRPFKRPYRRYYSFEFYKTMLTNDLLKMILIFKSIWITCFGILKILFVHFMKFPLSFERFQLTLSYIWTNLYELIPSINYLRVYLYDLLLPRLFYNIMYITSNANPYNKPFGLENRHTIRRYWRGKRRNHKDRSAIYNSLYNIFFNRFLLPIYIHVFKPIRRLTIFVTNLEYKIITTVATSYNEFFVSTRLLVLGRLLTHPIQIHTNTFYSKLLTLFFVLFNTIWNFIVVSIRYILYYIIPLVKPIILICFYVGLYIVKVMLLILKPCITLITLLNNYFNFILIPLKYLSVQFLYFFNLFVLTIYYFIYNMSYLFVYIVYKPLFIIVNNLLIFNYKVVFIFYNFYKVHLKYILNLLLSMLKQTSLLYVFNHFIWIHLQSIASFITIIISYTFNMFSYYFFNFIGYFVLFFSYLNLIYIEPVIYWIVSIYNIVLIHIVNSFYKFILKFIFLFRMYFNFHAVFYYFKFFISYLFKLVLYLIYPLFQISLSIFYRSIQFIHNYYFILILFTILFTSLLSSFCLNIVILLSHSWVYIIMFISYLYFYFFYILTLALYLGFFMLMPTIYLLITAIKFLLFIFIILLKIVCLYFCCIVYMLINLYNCYVMYLFNSDLNFFDFLYNIYDFVVIDTITYTNQTVSNFIKNIIHYFFKYSISNNIYDIILYYDYFMNKCSVEFYFTYKYIR